MSLANSSPFKQSFGAVTSVSNALRGNVSGILGLGRSELSTTHTIPPIETLNNAGLLTESVIGIALRRMNNVTGS